MMEIKGNWLQSHKGKETLEALEKIKRKVNQAIDEEPASKKKGWSDVRSAEGNRATRKDKGKDHSI